MLKTKQWLSIGVVLAVVCTGCASLRGPSDEEQIGALVTAWSDALIAKNVEGFMATYSENYKGENAMSADKAAMESFIKSMMSAGHLDNVTVDRETLAVAVDGDTATVTGLKVVLPSTTAQITLNLAKEEAGWLIVGSSTAT